MSYRVFLPSFLVPFFTIIFACVQIYVTHKRRLADSVWEVKEKELKFENPAIVIGVGSFGCVHLAEYPGTQVCVTGLWLCALLFNSYLTKCV